MNGAEPGCLLCGTAPLRTLGTLPDSPSTRVVRCETCNFAQLNPIPTDAELAAYYAHEYARQSGAADPASPGFIARKRREALDRWRFLDQRGVAPTGELLEIGCAEGEFLVLARERRLACIGIEPDAALAARAAKAASCTAVTGMFPCALPNDTFDIIASFHVIEHVPDPLAFLRECVARLRSGGALYIATPDLEETASDLAHPVFRPCHLMYFSAAALRAAMLAAGCREAEAVRTNVCGKPELKAIGRT